MLKKTVSLALLASLAAAASAQSVVSATSNLIASYDASAGISLGGVVFHEQNGTIYDAGAEDDYNYEETDGGRALTEHTAASTHAHVAGSRQFALASATSAALHSADYGAIRNYVESSAWRTSLYYVTFTNNGAASGTLTFSLNSQRAIQGSAASPFGVNFSPDGLSDMPGAYVYGRASAGVTDVTGGLGAFSAPGNFRTTENASSFYEEPGVFRDSFSDAGSGVFSPSTFTLGAGETRTYRVFAGATAYAAFVPAPVPEPASMVALAAGALGLLRRRRRV